jgi:hypothetical protein
MLWWHVELACKDYLQLSLRHRVKTNTTQPHKVGEMITEWLMKPGLR